MLPEIELQLRQKLGLVERQLWQGMLHGKVIVRILLTLSIICPSGVIVVTTQELVSIFLYTSSKQLLMVRVILEPAMRSWLKMFLIRIVSEVSNSQVTFCTRLVEQPTLERSVNLKKMKSKFSWR